jgi:hypothetical protein
MLSMDHLYEWPDVDKVFVEQVTNLYRKESRNNELAIGRPLCLVMAHKIDQMSVVSIDPSWSEFRVNTPEAEEIHTSW